jgi:hypothetical protein
LNLYEGQLLNFDLVEIEGQLFIRVFTGLAVDPGERAAFQEVFASRKRKEKGQKCGAKIRKSEPKRAQREKRIEDIKRGLVPSTATELREILSNLSGYLLSLQSRLSSLPGEF